MRYTLLFCILASGALLARPDSRPFQKLTVPEAKHVTLDDAFWAPRLSTCREVTIPYCLDKCEETGRIANFERAAGTREGGFQGAHFNDSDVYKIIEGAEWALVLEHDAQLASRVDEVVAKIARAQDKDGYLDTFFAADRRHERFQHIYPSARHELYCMGHAIEAGATRFELSGKRDFLEVAMRLADHIDSVFGEGKRREVPEHQQLELGLLKLYRLTGEKRYLELARFFVDERGHARGRGLYGAYSQDHLPIRKQSEIFGHAVRAMYNCASAADLYAESDDADLYAALRRLWESTTQRKMYVTGGVGATRQGEAFSDDFHLPNETAYSETCAQIGLIFWAHRMFLHDPDAEYIDTLERALYNGFLSGISLSGDRFFYQNRLASRGEYRRQPWYGCACCPSNVVRLIPQIGRYVYACGNNTCYVNLYVGGTGKLKLEGHTVTITQETRYPWSGKVKLRVQSDQVREFTLKLRIPAWCRDRETPGRLYRWDSTVKDTLGSSAPVLRVNGKTVPLGRLEKGYARIHRPWGGLDTVELDLPMPIRRLRTHPAVAANRGRVALQRGPIVYCLEGVDHSVPIHDVVLPADRRLEAEHRADLLGGVTVIRGKGKTRAEDHGEKDVVLTAIPYYARDNRGASDMAVWLVEDPERVGPFDTSGWVGSNYTPAYCTNQVQMWHDFRPETIERELAAARKHLGITTLRVYLHNMVFDAERETFLANIERFLQICERYEIRPGFVFFDDCHRIDGITLEPLPPVKGYHNGRWAACPQGRERTLENFPRFQAYVEDVVRAHATDDRVLWWEIYNEPNRKWEFSVELRKAAYAWAKGVEPEQPVLCCWDNSPQTDIVDAHNYGADFRSWDRQAELDSAKGTVFTEAGARWYGKRASNGEPCEVVHWLGARKSAGQSVPGVYLCWELMVGNSNCRWYWGTAQGTAEPPIPWCGLLWPDGTPVSLAEAEAIRRHATGERRALFFDDFESSQPRPVRPGWSVYGARASGGSGVLELEHGMKMLAGDPAWSDYVLEARVLLQAEGGNAGVLVRASEPGHGVDELHGYYVGFDTETLYLGRMNNNWKPLATFDLRGLECGITPGVWNLLRVEAQGPRLRVWFNRMHHDDGLRIDFTDSEEPILSGRVGVRAFRVGARYDNLVVLPVAEP